jgi:tetratricopeptide (TPR) repeat protein
LAALSHLKRDDEGALDYSQQALVIAEELGDLTTQAEVWNILGLTQANLGRFAEAEELHQKALSLRRELGLDHLALDTLAGLARVNLGQGELAAARAHVDEILACLDAGHTLEGTAEPIRVYLTCYRVLQANQDARAASVLLSAYTLLQERASKISDEELRRSYLENIAAHREIRSEWRARGLRGSMQV